MDISGLGISGKFGKACLPCRVIGLTPQIAMARIFLWRIKIACHSRNLQTVKQPVAVMPAKQLAVIALNIAGKIQRHLCPILTHILSAADLSRILRRIDHKSYDCYLSPALHPLSSHRQSLVMKASSLKPISGQKQNLCETKRAYCETIARSAR